jgi:type VI secretion system secreted protein Hcp
MADNVLILEIDTIPGNCEIKEFSKKIIVNSYSHSASLPIGADTANTVRTTGRPQLSEFSFSKSSDQSTTAMYKACTQGTNLGKVKLHVGRIEAGKFQKLLDYTMEKAMITRISTSGSSGLPSDSFSINFSKVTCEYAQQDATTTTKGKTTWNWDLETATST